MSIFPHRCDECGKWFKNEGHTISGVAYIRYFCGECTTRMDKETAEQGLPGRNATEQEYREYGKRLQRERRARYLKEFEEEERIKVRVQNEMVFDMLKRQMMTGVTAMEKLAAEIREERRRK